MQVTCQLSVSLTEHIQRCRDAVAQGMEQT